MPSPYYDFIHHARKTVSLAEHKVNDGHLMAWFQDIPALGINSSTWITFVTPASVFVHLQSTEVWTNSDELLSRIYEAGTSTLGTKITAINHNRTSSLSSTVSIVWSGTVSVDSGTMIEEDVSGGGGSTTPAGKGGGSGDGGLNELVLQESTTYIMKFTNQGAAAARLHLRGEWTDELVGVNPDA